MFLLSTQLQGVAWEQAVIFNKYFSLTVVQEHDSKESYLFT